MPPRAKVLKDGAEGRQEALGVTGRFEPVIPVYSYSLKYLTFASLSRILTSDHSALLLALSHEGIFHAIRCLSADHVPRLALPI
jgi:hypothetical protein